VDESPNQCGFLRFSGVLARQAGGADRFRNVDSPKRWGAPPVRLEGEVEEAVLVDSFLQLQAEQSLMLLTVHWYKDLLRTGVIRKL
jgi:hypothetical protein